MTYEEFLKDKKFKYLATGRIIDRSEINPILFDFQKDIVKWSVKKGRCAVFLDTGLGKTFCQLEWARLIGGRSLIVAPLSVARQTIREAVKIGIVVNFVHDQDQIKDGVNITNYELIDNFTGDIDAIVLDECFPPDTPIDVFNIDKSLELRYIKDVRPGDLIINAQGEDHVKNIYKRRIKRAVQISVDGRNITSSENHPFFTLYGWKSAQDLQPGDYIMATRTAMCLVREDYNPIFSWPKNAEVLRDILLSEMEDEHSGTQSEGAYEGSSFSNRREEKRMVSGGKSEGTEGAGANHKPQSNEESGNADEGVCYVAEDEAQTFRAWGKWKTDDIASAVNEGCSFREMDCGISYITGKTESRFSDMLQGRLRKQRIENSDRNRRFLPLQQKANRSEERCYAGFSRVDSVEILEQGHHELEKYRDADGNVYFYDIKAERHPSFSVNGLLVHNSSILKSISGKIKRKLIETFKDVPYKLCCTATPAPNDWPEIGNHAWFLGISTHQEMLAMFFINANKEHTFEIDGKMVIQKGSNKGGQEWRIKHHAEERFFEWMSSWAMFMMKPSDLGYSDEGYILPPLNIIPMVKEVNGYHHEDVLFFTGLAGISDRANVRKDMVDLKIEMLSDLIKDTKDQWVIWCGLDKESSSIKKLLGGICREVKGSDSIESKVRDIEDFQDGMYAVLDTKGKIGGFGLNLQNAHNMVFFGLNDSWEMFYQCIRREYRFGQKFPVNVYVLLTSPEIEIYENIKRKELQATRLRTKMIERMITYEMGEIMDTDVKVDDYTEDTVIGDAWKAMKGDSCLRLKEVGSESIDLTVYSPPFENLFVYSNSDRDLGNCRNADEFYKHYEFIVNELFRITKPGRLSCVHTSDIPAMANRDGFIGLKDFPGDVINLHIKTGWEFFGRCVIQKNPQAQAIRTKCKSLLFVQMKKDSSCSRPAIFDQILIFKKPGDNQVPIEPVKNGDLDNETWISWAHGIWTDIRETNTLQYYCGRDKDDEKHIAPLQLETIERCIKLYSNPGETVLTPFMGIGSEGFVAVKLGRRAIGCELKASYFKIAVQNLQSISATRHDLFSLVAV